MSDANANTAIGTTATVNATQPPVPYTGRFAPSPTGALHLGSLVAAAASYLEARTHGGRWLLRIEDLDSARVIPGAADRILRTLEALGFTWEGEIWYQSQRLAHYQAALQQLQSAGALYPCSCTRRDLGGTDDQGGYPGTCRSAPGKPGPTALRFRADRYGKAPIVDTLQGAISPGNCSGGDPVVRRRDGLHAYQLAVVVDDAASAVSHVVRGADLLASTGWQCALQDALALPRPVYSHIPLVTEPGGGKLSKSAHALGSAPAADPGVLYRVLTLLRQEPPSELSKAPPAQLWQWAATHWRVDRLRGVLAVAVDPGLD